MDHYWEKLSEGGDEKAQVYGWLKDRFGVSWQIIPASLFEMVSDPNPTEIRTGHESHAQNEENGYSNIKGSV